MRLGFIPAVASFAVVAVVAGITCDGKIRLAVWILLGGLALKTCIARAAGWR